MTWKAGGYILVCVCVCARAQSRGSYINTYFSQSFVSTKKREEGCSCRDGKRWGKREHKGRGREQGERTMCLFQKQFTQPVIFGTLAITEAEKKICSESVVFISFPQPNLLLTGSAQEPFFFQQGSVRVFVDEQGPECLCSEMDRLSSTLKKSLFPSAPAEVIR